MKMVAFMFPLVLNFLIAGEALPPTDIEDAIRAADFVGFVTYYGKADTKDHLMLGVTECFKGGDRSLAVGRYEAQFFKNSTYLFIVKRSGAVVTNFLHPITLVEDLRPATIDILNSLECYNAAVEKRTEEYICTREYFPICGCDNKTYGNVCEMQKAGIMKFKSGECE